MSVLSFFLTEVPAVDIVVVRLLYDVHPWLLFLLIVGSHGSSSIQHLDIWLQDVTNMKYPLCLNIINTVF